ncbi:MAG: ATP-binding protein [Saprospiraceae bacterium]
MKRFLLFTAFFLKVIFVDAQNETIDNLKYELSISKNDIAKLSVLDSLSMYYLFFSNKPDSAFYYINESINKAFPLDDKKYLILSYARMGFYFINTSQFKASLDITMKGINLSEESHIDDHLSALYYNLGWVYTNLQNFDLELKYANAARSQLKKNKDPFFDLEIHVLGQIGSAYLSKGKNDSAFYYFKRVDSLALTSKELAAKEISEWYLGNYYLVMKNHSAADSLFLSCIERCKKNNDYQILSACSLNLARSYIDQGLIPRAIAVALSALQTNLTINEKAQASYSARLLYLCHDKLGNRDSAFYYLKLSGRMSSAVMSASVSSQMQQINFDQELKKKEKESDQILQDEKNRRKILSYVFIMGILSLLLISFLQWRHNNQRKKANLLLQLQKEKVESTLSELKSTQGQLIQSEKMASLGELTAGIAHEIQNPLNFVNNFSEVNEELLIEMKADLNKGKIENAIALADVAIENQKKINHHGKRAEAIVRGMLQHSQASKGQKEPTDINALADEYMRLSYHGLRGKDKTFNAEFKMDLDPTMPLIKVIPQDIGRVLLNLFNNAFWAVAEKSKNLAGLSDHTIKDQRGLSGDYSTNLVGSSDTKANPNLQGYQPTVTLTTKNLTDHIEIIIHDNGSGIPESIKEKIFQPFFTTKPTGQGTGLGLSLAYDIIKAHSGIINMNSNKEGSTFQILLPIQ